MSIFKRQDPGDGQKTAAAPETVNGAVQAEQPMPPFVRPGAARGATAPGVVPPPAAPMYSMQVPEQLLVEKEPTTLAEKLRLAREARQKAQQILEDTVRIAVQRGNTTASFEGVRRRPARPGVAIAARHSRSHTRQVFDPVRAAQAGLLNLAWRWQQSGSTVRAIHAYVQVLNRYPDTPAAAAAVSDLVELSEILAGEGQYHIALGIYEQLEQLM